MLLTLHRAESVDDQNMLQTLKKHLSEINYKVIFPVHPRTRNNLVKYNIPLPDNVIMIEPVGYLEFLGLLKNCMLVLTDSGGVQEEAVVLRKPCITLRNTTERWETLLIKANRLFPLDKHQKNSSLNKAIEEMICVKIISNPYGENVTSNTKKLIHTLISTTAIMAEERYSSN